MSVHHLPAHGSNDRHLKAVHPGLDPDETANVPLVVYINAEGQLTDATDKSEGVTRHVIGEAVVRGEEISMSLADRGLADSVLDSLLSHPSGSAFSLSVSEINYRLRPYSKE
jgi:hypothetical protein